MANPQDDDIEGALKGGYLYFYRKWFNGPCFLDANLWKVFCWLWFKASHEDEWVSVKIGRQKTQVLVKRGQLLFGRHKAAKELRMRPRTLYDRIRKLSKLGISNIKPNSHYSIITVCNYDPFQTSKKLIQQPNPTTDQQPTNTYNKLKELRSNLLRKKAGAFGKVGGIGGEGNLLTPNDRDRLFEKNEKKENGNDHDAVKEKETAKTKDDGNDRERAPKYFYLSEECRKCGTKINVQDSIRLEGLCYTCSLGVAT